MLAEGISRTLISEEEVTKIVRRLGAEITEEYADKEGELLVVGILKGAFVFMADLIRTIHRPLRVDFMIASSYGDSTVSSGQVRIDREPGESVTGRHVLLVEDIVDTGITLHRVRQLVGSKAPQSLKICAFLNKPSRRVENVNIDFCGRNIPDEFVCGYGLDYDQKYRNLPYVGILGKA